ncbi:MAG: heme-binding domain-containing protein [Mariniphaga sp.]
MNKLVFPLFAIIVIALGILLLNSSFRYTPVQDEQEEQEEIQALLKNSCYECHGPGAKNEDALEALNFETYKDLGKVRKITRLKEMAEVVENRDMPPKKYISEKPHAELSDEQVKAFVIWANFEMKKLIGN